MNITFQFIHCNKNKKSSPLHNGIQSFMLPVLALILITNTVGHLSEKNILYCAFLKSDFFCIDFSDYFNAF